MDQFSTEYPRSELVRESLDFVNKVRALIGKDPISDLKPYYQTDSPSMIYKCPIAESIGSFWKDGKEYYPRVSTARARFAGTDPETSSSPSFDLPTGVRAFICEFDKGNFPEYERTA